MSLTTRTWSYCDDDGMAGNAWPFEGHFVVGGSGLYVTTDCLGRTLDSRTASYDLTIGLPQVDRTPDPYPPEIKRQLNMPDIPRWDLLPPAWTYGPRNSSERAEEESMMDPVWGGVLDDGRATGVYPESAKGNAVVLRCRFATTLKAADDQDFEATAQRFLGELDDFWTRFTSWVGILTGQDFVGLGGDPGGLTRTRPLYTWTADQNEQRADMNWRYFPPPNRGIPQRQLRLDELQMCAATAGNESPPAEWLLIRDARSLLGAGQNRRAIIDAATAAEVAMTALIDRHLAATDGPVRRALAEKYRALEGRESLLRLLKPGLLSDQLKRDLIYPRNRATHAGREFTDVQAEAAVSMATSIVERAHPLDSLLSPAISNTNS